MVINTDLKSTTLDNKEDRYCEIYKITNTITNKVYVGQAVSHILNHRRYRPYGMEGRFRCHVSEAFSTKTNQCHFLNNSLRKHGPENFTVTLLQTCCVEDADDVEREEIIKHNSIYPTGYNLKLGGKTFEHTDESRKRVSDGMFNYSKSFKIEKFSDVDVCCSDVELLKYIRPLNRHGIQYGWYVFINGKKADFGGSCIPMDVSKSRAIEFVKLLRDMTAKRLVAGTPLEPSLPLIAGNSLEELG